MKQIKLFSITLLFIASSYSSFSQISLGGQLSYSRYAGYGLGSLAIGVQGDLTKDRFVYRASLNFGLPSKYDRTFDLYYNDGSAWTSNENYAKSIVGQEKYTATSIWFDVNYFFTGDGEDGGFFGLAGLGLSMVTIAYDFEAFNEDTYYTHFDYTSKDRLFQPIIRLGLGYDFSLGFGNLFLEAYGNLPANSVSGASIDINLPFSYGGAAGVRIPIN
ncbi:MAG: hypothetical protein ACJASQ_003818 [Crocinitomicaceae bacterium]|jgi:hypothetical protein